MTRERAIRIGGLIALAFVYIAGALLLRSGRLMGEVALAFIVGFPIVVYVWMKWPIIMPFGFYVLLVPFDNLLSLGSFGTLTKLLAMVSGVALLLAAIVRDRFTTPPRTVLALLALFAWMVMSTAWALNQGASLTFLPTYGAIFALYAIIASFRCTSWELKTTMALVAVGGVAAALYGANLFYHNPVLAADPMKSRMVLQTTSATIDPNHFANALLLPAALIAMWGLSTRNLFFKMTAFAGLSSLAVGILLSGSREGLIGLGLILLYYLVRSRYRIQVGASVLFLTAVSLSIQTSMWDRFTKLFSSGGAGRSDIWRIGAEAAKHRLLQGYGISNFPDAYNLFYLGIPQVDPFGFSSPAHNIVVHYLVELGVIGFALLVFFFWMQPRILRSIPQTSSWYDYRIALEGAFIAISFVSLTIDLFTYKYAWLVFLLIAMMFNVARAERSDALRDAAHHVVSPSPLAHAPPSLEPTFASVDRRERSEIA